jgi:phosphohistidine phosphatase
MKSVLILRHAKSSWKQPDLNDHDRPLNKRGKRDAQRMGELLRNEHLIPESVISSAAIRARDTAKAEVKASGYKGKIALNRSLCTAGLEAYLKVLNGLSNDSVRVLVVGHNPGVEELVLMLTGETHPMSTCSLAHIKLHVERWLDVDYETKGQLAGICRPRDLS